MPYRRINIWKTIDWWTIGLFFILIIAGWLSIYGAGYDFDRVEIFNLSGRAGNQLLWMMISVIVGFGIVMVENDWYDVFAYWIYGFIIILLIVTIFLAPEIKGSRSWLVLGPVNVQPAEFAKFATALALAKFMNQYKFKLMELKSFAIVLALITVPMLFILMQHETGSALVFLAFFIVLYREGMPGGFLLAGFCATLFFILSIKFADSAIGDTVVGEMIVLLLILTITSGLIYRVKKDKNVEKYTLLGIPALLIIAGIAYLFFPYNLNYALLAISGIVFIYVISLAVKYWLRDYLLIAVFLLLSIIFLFSVDYVFNHVLEPHHQSRIQVSLGVTNDPGGAGYNVNQSKIAIGSGGFWGKGYLNGTQTKLKYVPEQDTDFIFCTVGEEKGFVGSAIVLGLFLTLTIRLIFLAERQRYGFNRIYGYSVASIIFFHVAINIGMVIGITPVIGIPLPFFSYGGSSLLSFTMLLFIFLRLDAGRSERL
ncbi:MAG: rod shape-determining protein RodA [Dysgonamonadaceae bacterium]|jgi:rod shape determining protein RodA|nr:rod shape-determining protein RodA [Dysgonamonadaceae bacterium]